MKKLLGKIPLFLASRRFFYGVLIFFVFQSAWIAFSARYPMAFDEDFHVGIIQIYSERWSPFLDGQPEGGNPYGALERDPSYLYHYLMNFPYRLLTAISDSQMFQVVTLRLLNTGFVLGALVLFRRLLLKAGMSPAYTHTALALFTLIPIMPLLAGQVNYDNLALLLTAWMCLLTVDIYKGFRRQHFDLHRFSIWVAVCMAGSLVKYAYLPLAAASAVFLIIGLRQGFRRRGGKALPAAVCAGWQRISRRMRWLLLAVLLLAGMLFVQRYVVNVTTYRTPIPECDVVLDVNACSEYGPWVRNYLLAQANDGNFNHSAIDYTWLWLQSLHYRLFFMVDGPRNSYENYPPVPLPSATAVLIAVSGLVAVVLYARRIFSGRPVLAYLGLMSAGYMAVLWGVQTYPQFLETGEPVAINGRYLIPVLLPLAAVLGQAFHEGLRLTPRFKTGITVFVLLMFLQGGGVFSFMLRSNDKWYWPQPIVRQVNHAAQTVVSRIMIQGVRYY